MRFTPRSILFLFSLTTIVVFFFGFNAGKYIDSIDKAHPAPTPIPTQIVSPEPTQAQKQTAFGRVLVEPCGISFLLPTSFQKTSTASQEATFADQSGSVMVNCQKEHGARIQPKLSTMASSSALLVDQNVTIYASDAASTIILKNKQKLSVFITVTDHLEDLIKDTLKLQ